MHAISTMIGVTESAVVHQLVTAMDEGADLNFDQFAIPKREIDVCMAMYIIMYCLLHAHRPSMLQ